MNRQGLTGTPTQLLRQPKRKSGKPLTAKELKTRAKYRAVFFGK